ncbi:MAG: hypothetical protein WBO24_18235, partial [Nitrospirales bacterium]
MKVLNIRPSISRMDNKYHQEQIHEVEKDSSGRALRPLEEKAADTRTNEGEKEFMGWKKLEAEPLNMERHQPG